jgi:hypothetical protein
MVLAHRDEIPWVVIGAEVVVYDPFVAESHVLDAVSALVWQCLDGESPLADIFADVADGFGVPASTVEDDFIPVVTDWLNAGLAQEVNRD